MCAARDTYVSYYFRNWYISRVRLGQPLGFPLELLGHDFIELASIDSFCMSVVGRKYQHTVAQEL
jgi:hypothetical protein